MQHLTLSVASGSCRKDQKKEILMSQVWSHTTISKDNITPVSAEESVEINPTQTLVPLVQIHFWNTHHLQAKQGPLWWGLRLMDPEIVMDGEAARNQLELVHYTELMLLILGLSSYLSDWCEIKENISGMFQGVLDTKPMFYDPLTEKWMLTDANYIHKHWTFLPEFSICILSLVSVCLKNLSLENQDHVGLSWCCWTWCHCHGWLRNYKRW